ncbi:MAG: hypothetical protein E7282_11980 [Lachnospiraceae bacterium]|nr:hypothetical protein [Lachnospiraceae bacterium]
MIFLNILKIIGIIILIILLLAILILAAVLFIPVRYRINIDGNQTFGAKAKVGWFLKIASFRFQYLKDQGVSYSLRIFGIILFGDSSSKPGNQSKADKKDRFNEDKSETDKPESKNIEIDKTDKVETDKTEKDKAETDKTENLISSIKSRIDHIKKIFLKWKKIIQDQHNQNAARLIKSTLIIILKRCMPDKMYLNAVYSTGSPDTTAEALGVAACFPIGYQNKWKIIPDFESEKAYFNGEGLIKGKIYIYQILFPILKVFFDKECRRLYKMVTK